MTDIEPLVIDDELDTICDAIRLGALRNPDAKALINLSDGTMNGPQSTWTYSELFADVIRTANLFQAVGFSTDNVVSILLPNCPETLISFFAASAVGIANPINAYMNIDHIIAICQTVGTTILVTEGPENRDAWPKVEKLLAEVATIKSVVVVGGSGAGENVHAFWPEVLLQDSERLSERAVARGAGDIAAYFHTGGTTGTPKIAQHTHLNEIANSSAFAARTQLGQITAMGLGLPFFHVAALIVCTLAPWIVGRAVVILGPLGYRDRRVVSGIWETVAELPMDALMTVPTVAAGLLDAATSDGAINQLKVAACGASPVPAALAERWRQRMNAPLTLGYGLTESTCLGTCMPRPPVARPGSVGKALPGHQIRVIPLGSEILSEAASCPPGEHGLVLLRGPNIFPGYLDATLNEGILLPDGWLNTQDIGYLDDDGFLFLAGRAKDLIKRAGHGLDPAAIEEALVSHPQVKIAAAVGKPDSYTGELPVAYIEIASDGAPPDLIELRNWCRERIGDPAAVPTEIFIVDRVPVTAVGKISKVELRRDAARRTAQALADTVLDGTGAHNVVRCDSGDGTNLLVEVTVHGQPDVERLTEMLAAKLNELPIQSTVMFQLQTALREAGGAS